MNLFLLLFSQREVSMVIVLLSQMLSFTLFIAINLIGEGNSRSKPRLLVLILQVA